MRHSFFRHTKALLGTELYVIASIAVVLVGIMGYSLYLIAESPVRGAYKLVAFFVAVVLYSNFLSSLMMIFLDKRVDSEETPS